MRIANLNIFGVACAFLPLLWGCGNDATTAGNENGGRKANDNQSAYVALADAGACDNSRYGKEIYVASESRYYVCDGGQWTVGTGAGSSLGHSSVADCSSSSSEDDQSDGLGACSRDNDGEIKKYAWTCDNGTWRETTDSEKEVGFGCTALGVGKERLVAGYMLCSQPGVWTVTTHTVEEGYYSSDKTVGIGTQTWKVMNVDRPYKVNNEYYGNLCYGNGNDLNNCHLKGTYNPIPAERLYSWAAAMDTAKTGCGYGKTCSASSGKVQGICGTGEHLPSKSEWKVLLAGVGGERAAREQPLIPDALSENIAGRMLKSTKGWYGGGNGENAYGFAAVPSGEYSDIDRTSSYSAFDNKSTCFWSSSEDAEHPERAYCVCLSYNSESASLSIYCQKYAGHVVRCMKDK